MRLRRRLNSSELSADADILALPLEKWAGNLKNDFETTVFARHPELKRIKDSLYDSGAVYAAMSGSGSALFGIYRK
ncbi:MAG: hypothetical protein J6B62_08600 [Bacteroidales bacterium]|nr:hypothetical protein [Bacteroidales bacterium]